MFKNHLPGYNLLLAPIGIIAGITAGFTGVSTAEAATVTPVATGLKAAIGQSYHKSDNSVFFVDWSAGNLAQLNLMNQKVSVFATGYVNPQDVQVVSNGSDAFVTTRDGNLWQTSINTSTKVNIASGLGMPHQLVIDEAAWVAYTVDYSGGTLWMVDLKTSEKTALATGLEHPTGLLMSADYKTAFVAEPTQIVSVSLKGNSTRKVLTSGLTNAFYMEWANSTRSALYFVERDPANRLSRLDLSSRVPVRSLITTVPFRPSSVVRSGDPNVLYVASDSEISKVQLREPLSGPVILALGLIPSTAVNDGTGLATTEASYLLPVKNAAFGGEVQIIVNFDEMRNQQAAYYKIVMDSNSDSQPAIESWVNYKWNGSAFVAQTIIPNSNGLYSIPAASEVYSVPDLGFVLNTTKYPAGVHKVHVELYNSAQAKISSSSISMDIDNVAPSMQINGISHDGSPLNQCALITSGSSTIQITATAWDNQGHLYDYSLVDEWGHGNSFLVKEDSYSPVHDGQTTWYGVKSDVVSLNLSQTSTACAHSIVIQGYGNVTNGEGYIQYASDFDTLAVYLGGDHFCLK